MKPILEPLKRWCFSPARDRRNELRILGWMLAWMLSWLGIKYAVTEEWMVPGWPLWLAVAGTGLLGLATVWAYLRFLRHLDELRRKIELEALALAFGVGVVAGLTSTLLADAGVVEWDQLVSYLFTLMFVTYSIGAIAGYRRYS